ncbi:MAG: DUF116 domain-containing protein [Candidatus Thorarchaeota archaeon]
MTEQTKPSDSIDLPEIDVHHRIRELAVKIAKSEPEIGLDDLSKRVTGELEIIEESLVNFTYIEAGNVLNLDRYESVPMDKRILLIPHCLRDAESCIAPIDDEGYHCQKCGACIISEITLEAESKGIKWYMVGGGSHAIRVVKNARPHAVLGIACFDDAKLATDKIGSYGIPTQAVLLSKDGCVNTEVDFDSVVTKIDIE